MAGEYVVRKSELINNADEARNYYAQRLQRAWRVDVGDDSLIVVFQPQETHMFSEEITAENQHLPKVSRRFKKTGRRPGRTEERAFSVDRARLMDQIIPAIRLHKPCVASKTYGGKQVFGPPLGDGRRLTVVLRPGLDDTWNVVTAFPVEHEKWLEAVRAKPIKLCGG